MCVTLFFCSRCSYASVFLYLHKKDWKEPEKPEPAKLIIEAEKRAVGRPKLSLFTSYFRYCGGVWFGVAWAVLSAAWQGLMVAQSFTLKVRWWWLCSI